MDFGLGEDIDALRETVRKFAQEEIAPKSAEVDRSNDFPGALGDDGKFRLAWNNNF